MEEKGRLMRGEWKYSSILEYGLIDGMRGNVHLEKKGNGGGGLARIGCISRVNGAMEVDRGRLIWELLARSCVEHVSEVWWTRGKEACKNLGGKIQENIGWKLASLSPPEVPLFVQIIYNNNS